jgi:exodeoxyribonuclease VII large subunit
MDIFSQRTVLTVSRLTSLLKGVLEDNFDQVWVEGEVSNLAFPASGHIYFTLKDSGAMIRCVMFKTAAKSLKFRIEDGLALLVRGRLSVYDQRGEYQILCEYLEPVGAGALQLAFEQLKERLAKEGLFDPVHKQELPLFPRRVGVVTSQTGAAIHDILNVLGRRFASLHVLLYPVRVQGEGAAAEIAHAIDELNRLKDVDVLIVGRGGGSMEDLSAFNDELVARAVFRSALPVISAVGHETDWTITDFVADLRAPTPSAAAELVCKAETDLWKTVENLSHRMQASISLKLSLLRSQLEQFERPLRDPGRMLGPLAQHLDDLGQRLGLAISGLVLFRQEQFKGLSRRLDASHPETSIQGLRTGLELLEERLCNRISNYLERHRGGYASATAKLDSLSPLKTLARGYAVAERVDNGKVLKDSSSVNTGDQVRLRLDKGRLICRVEEKL